MSETSKAALRCVRDSDDENDVVVVLVRVVDLGRLGWLLSLYNLLEM